MVKIEKRSLLEESFMTEKEKVTRIYQDVLSGKRKRFPNYFFTGAQGEKYLAYLTRYLIEDYLSIPVEKIPEEVKAETLWNHRLRPAAHTLGWRDFLEVIENAYPERFHSLEFKQVPWNYWKGESGRERAIKVLRDIIENKCQIPHHEIPVRVNHHFFKEHHLGGIFTSFGYSPYQVINAVYPGQFQPWELPNVPMNYWKNPENIKQALDWFLFQKLGFSSYEEALAKIKKKDFFHYRLTGMFQVAFNSRMFNVHQWIKENHFKSINE